MILILLTIILRIQTQQDTIDTNTSIQLLCGSTIGTSFTTQIHLPSMEIPNDGSDAFFFFTHQNIFNDYEENIYTEEIIQIAIDDQQPQENFMPVFFQEYDKDYNITVTYDKQLYAPYEIGQFNFIFELFSFYGSTFFKQKVDIQQRKGIFEEIQFDQTEIGKVGCLQIVLIKPFEKYPINTLLTIDLGMYDHSKLNERQIEVFLKNHQIKNVSFEIENDLLIIKNFDRDSFIADSQMLDLSICNLEIPFIYKETKFGIYNKEVKPKFHLFESSKQLLNNMPKFEINYGLNNSLNEDQILFLDINLKTISVSILMLKGFRMLFQFEGQQEFSNIEYQIKNLKNNNIVGEGVSVRFGEYFAMQFLNDIDLKDGIYIELKSKEKVKQNVQMNQIHFNFLPEHKTTILFNKNITLPLFVFKSANLQNVMTLSNYNAGLQSNMTLLLSRDQIGFIRQEPSDIIINYNNVVYNTDDTIVKFKANSESLQNEKTQGGIIIKDFNIQKYAKMEFEIKFLKNSWFDTTVKDVSIIVQNKSEKFEESFLLQLIRPSIQVQDFEIVHFENKFQANLKILTSEQILTDHYLRIALPKSFKINTSTKCAKINQTGQSKDLNCFEIEQDINDNYYFKIQNVFIDILPQTYSEFQFIGQTYDFETQDSKKIKFDIIGDDPDNIFDAPLTNLNLSYQNIIDYQIPCQYNCQFCFSNVFSCDKCIEGYFVNDGKCLLQQKQQTDIVIQQQLEIVYTASFFRLVLNLFISISFLGISINLYLKMTFKNQFNILEGLIVVFSFQHSLLNYILLYQIASRSQTTNQLIFGIIIVLVAIILNVFLTIFISTKKNFLYSKVRIFNIRSDSFLIMGFYIIFGTGCSLWISAFNYIENLGKLYFTGKDKKQFGSLTRILKIVNSIFVLLETVFFLMIFLINSDTAQIIFIYFTSGVVLFIFLIGSLLTSNKKIQENKVYVSSVVNPVKQNFKYIDDIENIDEIYFDETQSEDPYEKELIKTYLGNLKERLEIIKKRGQLINRIQLKQKFVLNLIINGRRKCYNSSCTLDKKKFCNRISNTYINRK